MSNLFGNLFPLGGIGQLGACPEQRAMSEQALLQMRAAQYNVHALQNAAGQQMLGNALANAYRPLPERKPEAKAVPCEGCGAPGRGGVCDYCGR